MVEPKRAVDQPYSGTLPQIITIDGPAASGKSTVGHALADRLHYLYIDTGVLYRAVTWAALARDLDLGDTEAVAALAESLPIALRPPRQAGAKGGETKVIVDGQDVTGSIRTPEVDRYVSLVAANPRVRAALTHHQRRIALRFKQGNAEEKGLVMVGRDIGTVVLPDAPLKIYLDAPVEERAHRRHQELTQRGKQVPYEQVLADIRRRDQIDTQRSVSPLRPAEDAHLLDTRGRSPDEIVAQILALIG